MTSAVRVEAEDHTITRGAQVIERMPFAEYAKLDEVNISTLLAMRESPKAYRHAKSAPRKDKDSYRVGRATHTATLEPMQFLREYRLWEGGSRRTKAYREWQAQVKAEGKTELTEAQYRSAEAMAEAVHDNVEARSWLQGAETEATIRWVDGETSIVCKGRIDALGDAVVDVKTTRHAEPEAFGRDCSRYSYHTRLAFYRDGVAAATGEVLPVIIIAVQNEPPYDVTVYRVPLAVLEQGCRNYARLLHKLKWCRDNDEWPGAAGGGSGLVDLPFPEWALEDVADEVVSVGWDKAI